MLQELTARALEKKMKIIENFNSGLENVKKK